MYFNLYHYEVKDQQLTAVGGANNAVRLLNADKTVGQGAELDFQAYLTPKLLVTLGASYNDTEIKDDGISGGNLLCLHGHRSDRPRATRTFRRDRRQSAAAGARSGLRISRCAMASPSATASCSPTPTGLIAAK